MKQKADDRFQKNQIITKKIHESNSKTQEKKEMQPLNDNEMKRFIRYPKKPEMMNIERPKSSFEQRKIIVPKKLEEPKPEQKVHSSNATIDTISPTSTGSPTQQVITPQASFSPTPADKALLSFLLQMKYMTMEQVDRRFLGNQQSALSFRLLLAGGYIKCKDGSPNPNSLLVPTQKAYDLLKIENPNKDVPKPVQRVFDPVLNHDLKLVELRLKFEKLNFIEKWFSESMLEEVPVMKEIFADLPDAVCKKNNEKGYFLELEISQKSFRKYEERIALYEQVLERKEVKDAGIEGVIFLGTDPKVFGIIKERLPKAKNFSVLMLNRYLKEKAA